MSVDDWARREADKAWAWEEPAATAYVQGIVHAFSALLSDEAVQLAATELAYRRWPDDTVQQDPETVEFMVEQVRAALQAAIDAVTKEARND